MKLSHVMTFILTFLVYIYQASQLLIIGCNQNGAVTVRDNTYTFMCSGLVQAKGVKWTLHLSTGTEMLVGMCDSQKCWNNLPNVNIKWKNKTLSELDVLQFDTHWNDSLLLCTDSEIHSRTAACVIVLFFTLSSTTIFTVKSSERMSTTALGKTRDSNKSDYFTHPSSPLRSAFYSTMKSSEILQTTSSNSADDETNYSKYPSSTVRSAFHFTQKLNETVPTFLSKWASDSTFHQSSNNAKFSLTPGEDMVSSYLSTSSKITAEVFPSVTTSRNLNWIIGCAILSIVVVLCIIIVAIVYQRQKQRRNCDYYNSLDIMGDRIKPLWTKQKYDNITL